jgi:hypothetical protein
MCILMQWSYITCSQVRWNRAVRIKTCVALDYSKTFAGTPPFYYMHPMDAARAVANDKLRPTIPESLPGQVKYVAEAV